MESKGGRRAHTLRRHKSKAPDTATPIPSGSLEQRYPRMPTTTRCQRDLHLLLFAREARRLEVRLCPEAVQDSGPMSMPRIGADC
jgi:hypothetical protein